MALKRKFPVTKLVRATKKVTERIGSAFVGTRGKLMPKGSKEGTRQRSMAARELKSIRKSVTGRKSLKKKLQQSRGKIGREFLKS